MIIFIFTKIMKFHKDRPSAVATVYDRPMQHVAICIVPIQDNGMVNCSVNLDGGICFFMLPLFPRAQKIGLT